MAAPRRSSRSRFVLLLLVLTAGTIMTLDYRGQAGNAIERVKNAARDAFSPVESGLSSAFRPVGNFFEGAFKYGSTRHQNAALRKQVGDLKRQVSENADNQRQLQQLLALANLPFAEGIKRVTAEVVYTNFSNFQLSVQLDRGADSGVAKGMSVVAGPGLLGRVVEVSRHQSTVLLLTDPTSSVGVRVNPSGSIGIATGQGTQQPLRVDYLPPGTSVHKGDVLVTSGASGSSFPPGIPVGRVANAVQRPDALQEDVTLSPLVDPHQLQYVDILIWTGQ